MSTEPETDAVAKRQARVELDFASLAPCPPYVTAWVAARRQSPPRQA